MEKATSAVWQPRRDGPAGRDPDVRLAQWRQVWVRDRIPRIWSSYVFVALLCLLLGLPVSTGLAAIAVLVVGGFMLGYWLRIGRPLLAVGRLLEAEPARLVDVEVLDRRVVRSEHLVLRLPDGVDDAALQRALAASGVNAMALSGYVPSGRIAPYPGLVVGYASLGPDRLRAAVDVMAEVAA